jgi:hypothetical protein
MNRAAVLFAALVCSACSSHQHPDILHSSDAALPYMEANCENGARIRTLTGQVAVGQTFRSDEPAKAEGLLLDEEFAACSNETSDAWLSQVARLLAIANSNIDDNVCRQHKPAQNRDPSFTETSWKLYYSCEVVSAQRRLDSVKAIISSTSFPDVRAFGEQIQRITEMLTKMYSGEAKTGQAFYSKIHGTGEGSRGDDAFH